MPQVLVSVKKTKFLTFFPTPISTCVFILLLLLPVTAAVKHKKVKGAEIIHSDFVIVFPHTGSAP